LIIQVALNNSFGFGGTNAAVVFRRYDGKERR
jgi:3-oxoacyl-(acyl-carrier-protein) synthase